MIMWRTIQPIGLLAEAAASVGLDPGRSHRPSLCRVTETTETSFDAF